MRPRGEIREALFESALDLVLVQERPDVTWRDMAVHAQVGFEPARRTVVHMAKAGDLAPAGTRRVPGVNRPMTTYRPAIAEPQHITASATPAHADTWAAFA